MNCFKNYNESRPTRHSRSKKYYGRIEKTGTIVAPPPERSDSAYGRSNADSSRLSVACQAWKKRRSIAKETKKSEREKGGQKVEEEAAAGNSIQPVGSLGSLERDIPDSRRRAWIILHGPLLTRAPLKNRAPPNRNQISICRWATATSLRLLLLLLLLRPGEPSLCAEAVMTFSHRGMFLSDSRERGWGRGGV